MKNSSRQKRRKKGEWKNESVLIKKTQLEVGGQKHENLKKQPLSVSEN